jgi:hypothetical protein
MSPQPTHVAAFRFDDPDALLEASLSCQFCLRRSVLAVVVESERHCCAFCHCAVCRPPTKVLLTPLQASRLVRAPPASCSVQLAS